MKKNTHPPSVGFSDEEIADFHAELDAIKEALAKTRPKGWKATRSTMTPIASSRLTAHT